MTQNGTTLAQLDSIQDTEITINLEMQQEGYLGETTDRYDEVFKGMKFSFTVHLTQGSVYDIIQAIIDRARRRTPSTVFNLKTTLAFPNGQRKRVILDNLFFSEIPNSLPKRDQYVSVKFSGASSGGRFL